MILAPEVEECGNVGVAVGGVVARGDGGRVDGIEGVAVEDIDVTLPIRRRWRLGCLRRGDTTGGQGRRAADAGAGQVAVGVGNSAVVCFGGGGEGGK